MTPPWLPSPLTGLRYNNKIPVYKATHRHATRRKVTERFFEKGYGGEDMEFCGGVLALLPLVFLVLSLYYIDMVRESARSV